MISYSCLNRGQSPYMMVKDMKSMLTTDRLLDEDYDL